MKRNERKQIAALTLLALCAALLAGCGADSPQQPQPKNSEVAVEYECLDALKNGHVEVFGLTVLELEDGSLRYTLDYQAPAGMECAVLSDPEGVVSAHADELTGSERASFQFIMSPEQQKACVDIGVILRYADDDLFAVIWHPGVKAEYGESVSAAPQPVDEPVSAAPQPVGEPRAVQYMIRGELPADGEIHSFTAQELDNGDVRYTLEYTLPADLNTMVSEHNGQRFAVFLDPTEAERAKLVFDLSEEQSGGCSGGADLSFWVTGEATDSFSVFFLTQVPSHGVTPIGASREIVFQTEDELQATGAQIHSVSAQKLDNGYTRYTLDYTMPEGLDVLVFDPPVGEHVSLYLLPTAGGREERTFELSDELTGACGELAVSFYKDDNSRFFVFFQP